MANYVKPADMPLVVRVEGPIDQVAGFQVLLEQLSSDYGLQAARSSRIGSDGTVWLSWTIGPAGSYLARVRRRRSPPRFEDKF